MKELLNAGPDWTGPDDSSALRNKRLTRRNNLYAKILLAMPKT